MYHKTAVISFAIALLASSAQATIGQDGTLPAFKDVPVDIAKLSANVQLFFTQGTQPVLVIHAGFDPRPGDPPFGYTSDIGWSTVLLTVTPVGSTMRD